MFLIDCCVQNAFSLSCMLKKPKDTLRGKQERVTELALHLMKLNASDRLNYIDNFDDRGYKKNIVAKIRSLANVRAKMLLFFQFV